jgi:hypothetical protein
MTSTFFSPGNLSFCYLTLFETTLISPIQQRENAHMIFVLEFDNADDITQFFESPTCAALMGEMIHAAGLPPDISLFINGDWVE